MTTEDRATCPTLYLTNLSSKKWHGPGRKICGMSRPGRYHRGDGRCAPCLPFADHLARVREALAGPNDAGQHRAALATYRGAFEKDCDHYESLGRYAPGALPLVTWAGLMARASQELVADGDTVFCACARPGSTSRRSPCHIELLVPYLVRDGWDVRIDGRLVTMIDGSPAWGEGEPGHYRAEAFGWPEAT